MATKTKKVGSAGRLRAGYGKKLREKIRDVEKLQKNKQKCPYCKKEGIKRISSGVWLCKNKRCDKKFTSNSYYLGEK